MFFFFLFLAISGNLYIKQPFNHSIKGAVIAFTFSLVTLFLFILQTLKLRKVKKEIQSEKFTLQLSPAIIPVEVEDRLFFITDRYAPKCLSLKLPVKDTCLDTLETFEDLERTSKGYVIKVSKCGNRTCGLEGEVLSQSRRFLEKLEKEGDEKHYLPILSSSELDAILSSSHEVTFIKRLISSSLSSETHDRFLEEKEKLLSFLGTVKKLQFEYPQLLALHRLKTHLEKFLSLNEETERVIDNYQVTIIGLENYHILKYYCPFCNKDVLEKLKALKLDKNIFFDKTACTIPNLKEGIFECSSCGRTTMNPIVLTEFMDTIGYPVFNRLSEEHFIERRKIYQNFEDRIEDIKREFFHKLNETERTYYLETEKFLDKMDKLTSESVSLATLLEKLRIIFHSFVEEMSKINQIVDANKMEHTKKIQRDIRAIIKQIELTYTSLEERSKEVFSSLAEQARLETQAQLMLLQSIAAGVEKVAKNTEEMKEDIRDMKKSLKEIEKNSSACKNMIGYMIYKNYGKKIPKKDRKRGKKVAKSFE